MHIQLNDKPATLSNAMPEKTPGNSVSSAVGMYSASPVPTTQQRLNVVEAVNPISNLPQAFRDMPQARIYHPKQAPSAISSENFLIARAAMNPGFVQNTANTNIARISDLYRDLPRFRNVLDILV
jgi:hypothetical protein